MPAQRTQVSSGQLLTACRLAWEQDARLIALWASDERDRRRGFCVRVALEDADGLTVLEHTLPDVDARYPDLTPIFPAANRMQRATYDLVGVAAESDDQRPWLWLASWPIDQFPLHRDFVASPKWQPGQEEYDFVKVEGDGVHEIPVGPVHAGIIEPGHFRFQVVGEKVLRLEERLGYAHKGIEKRFESLSILDGGRLAGRVSGDSTVAYAWAYAQAVECIGAIMPPPRAAWLRALCLERERLANHLGDLGALGNDGGFAFGLAQFSRLREDVLRTNDAAFGHRLLMDVVVPGGVARDLALRACAFDARRSGPHRGRDRRTAQHLRRACGTAGPLSHLRPRKPRARDQAGAARACGARQRASRVDLRCDFPCAPYDVLNVRIAVDSYGDVAARVAVRFAEALESTRLIAVITGALLRPAAGDFSAARSACPRIASASATSKAGAARCSWRSRAEPDGTIRRCHPHDPSWSNWPVIEHAVIGNIVPDFPLINKSFNLSYSGHDL